MWIQSSTPSPRRPISRHLALALLLCWAPVPAAAQLTVFDPTNHVENALQAARQLQSLTNQAQMLVNQARELAASPYSHLRETSQTLKEIGDLAQSVRGVAASITELESQFDNLYPTAVEGLDPQHARQGSLARIETARATAHDLARTAAELERLSLGRDQRLNGAVAASQGAGGQTAAIQSSTQVLALLAEDLGSTRAILLAQSRLMAEEAARRAADPSRRRRGSPPLLRPVRRLAFPSPIALQRPAFPLRP